MSSRAAPAPVAMLRAGPRVRADALSGTPLVVGVVCVAVALLASASQAYRTPGWADPLSLGSAVAAFLAPLGAGAAAVHVGRRRRAGWLDAAQATILGRGAALTVFAGSILAWLVLALLASTAVALLRADLSGPFTPAMLLLPLIALVTLLSSVTIGTAVGARTSGVLAGPLVAIVLFGFGQVAFYLRIGLNLPWLIWAEPIPLDFFYGVLYQPRASFVWTQIAAVLGIGLLASGTMLSRRVGAIALAMAVALLLGAGVAMTRTEASPVALRPAPADAPCVNNSDVSLCVWPEVEDVAEPTLTLLTRTRAAAVPVLPDAPSRFVQPGLHEVQPDSATVAILSTDLSEVDVSFVAEAFVPPITCTTPTALDARSQVINLLMARAGTSTYPPGEDITTVLQQPDAAQRTWVQTRLAASQTCPS